MAACDSIYFFFVSPQLQWNLQRFVNRRKAPRCEQFPCVLLANRKQLFSLVQLRVWLLMEMKWEAKRKASACVSASS